MFAQKAPHEPAPWCQDRVGAPRSCRPGRPHALPPNTDLLRLHCERRRHQGERLNRPDGRAGVRRDTSNIGVRRLSPRRGALARENHHPVARSRAPWNGGTSFSASSPEAASRSLLSTYRRPSRRRRRLAHRNGVLGSESRRTPSSIAVVSSEVLAASKPNRSSPTESAKSPSH